MATPQHDNNNMKCNNQQSITGLIVVALALVKYSIMISDITWKMEIVYTITNAINIIIWSLVIFLLNFNDETYHRIIWYCTIRALLHFVIILFTCMLTVCHK